MPGGDVDNRESRVDLSGLLGDLPSIKHAQQIDVGHERAVRGDAALEQGYGLFARSGDSRFKTAFCERIFNDALNGIVIFNHENNGLIFQRKLPRLPSLSQWPILLLPPLRHGERFGERFEVAVHICGWPAIVGLRSLDALIAERPA